MPYDGWMEGSLDSRLIARQPQQERSRLRFEKMLDGARELLIEGGLNGFSIPALAERVGYSRASIYQFFPTPYALINELMRSELAELESLLEGEAEHLLGVPWQDTIAHIVTVAGDFHNAHPVGRMLILGGPVSDEGHLAQSLTIQHLGRLARDLLANRGFRLPEEPDVAVLAVDIGTTCMRLSFHKHGTVTPAYRDEAMRAMITYLLQYAPQS